ncbi:ZIP family metal transporter [Aporhodopirellula aestuarii]|uniref:Divalent cation transporter n=1 Tax=Aporhodopirellula aestuarii TaxID=2950107 RepID=A0ABT0UC57_9BACT|nr:divalent cation transporter [Aporhodopirellula aestuarii]MCM2374607.1 divalent cation transporter [Aporhodopirellula aestuarii]
MSPIVELLILTGIAGAAIPIGGVIASIEHIRPKWLEDEFRHTVIAFGGGALVSAVALVLIPDGIKTISTLESVTAFAAGGLFFWALQIMLDRSQSSASQLVAMLSDFIPEVIALGATIALGKGGAILLASIIALQNLPEGFNSYREFIDGGLSKSKILWAFIAAALLGPPLGAFGFWMLSDHPRVMGWMQVFAAAGILYLVFEDIAPQVPLKRSSFPPLGAVLGFLLGLLGKLLDS